MSKSTLNLVLRALIGVAASLVIVGAMGLITESGGNKLLLEQASGVKAGEAVMTVNGEAVTAEEYLYTVVYQTQNLASYGITDLSTDLGDGVTAADYVTEQAKSETISNAALRAWAKEKGVTLTEEDLAALAQSKDSYGDEAAFAQMLSLVGCTEELYDTIMTQEMLYYQLYERYCASDGADRPADDALYALAKEHKLVSAYVLMLDTYGMEEAALAEAKTKMEDYAAQLSAAEDKMATFSAFAAELACADSVQTFDCCHSSPLNDAVQVLAKNEVSAVVEADGVLYVLMGADLDLDTVAYVAFMDEANHRVGEATVEYNEKVLGAIDAAAFYNKYVQLQTNAYMSSQG